MSFATDRFQVRFDAQDTVVERQRKVEGQEKLLQQSLGRLDCYNAMEEFGVSTETINKIKDKFHDRLDY